MNPQRGAGSRKKLVGLSRYAPHGYGISNDPSCCFMIAMSVVRGACLVSRKRFRVKSGDSGRFRKPLSFKTIQEIGLLGNRISLHFNNVEILELYSAGACPRIVPSGMPGAVGKKSLRAMVKIIFALWISAVTTRVASAVENVHLAACSSTFAS